MATKFEIIDDNGNLISPPDPTSPVGQLIYLIEYCRKRDFAVGPTIQVDNVIVQIRDLRQQASQADKMKIPDDGDVWIQNGYNPKAGTE